jgi:hypothetical protein
MSIEENARIVKDFFAATERGDRQSLLALCDEDIEWTIPGEEWPLAGTRRGHAGMVDLFRTHAETMETASARHSTRPAPSFISISPPGPFHGHKREGAKVSQGLVQDWWRQDRTGSAKAHYDFIEAFSETDFTEDMTKRLFTCDGERLRSCPHWRAAPDH